MIREFQMEPFEWFTQNHTVAIKTKTRTMRGIDPIALENWVVAQDYKICAGDSIVFIYG